MDQLSALLMSMFREELKKVVAEVLAENKPQTKDPDNAKYVTRRQAKEELHVSYPTLNRFDKDGILKARKIGGRVLYLWSDIEQAIKQDGTLKYRRAKNSSLYR